MKILIIRHGDPNYEIDGLTEKGKIEAELLCDRLVKEDIKKVYCSTLGRAKATIQPTLDKLGITAEYPPWLREFGYATIDVEGKDDPIPWDLLPEFVENQDKIYSESEWMECDFIKRSKVYEHYLEVTRELDNLLARHGYVREGKNYKVVNRNHDTIVLVCHFGVTAVLLSHIFHTSPYSIWQNMCTLPTAVTTIYTEERREGIASLRASSIGDLSHLYKAGVEPSFSARFCECFGDDTRH